MSVKRLAVDLKGTREVSPQDVCLDHEWREWQNSSSSQPFTRVSVSTVSTSEITEFPAHRLSHSSINFHESHANFLEKRIGISAGIV